MFQNVTGKMGNMRKAQEWVIYPLMPNGNPNERTIQCDKRIAKVNLETGKVILSTGKNGHNGFAHLSPMLGAVEVDCPQDLIDQIKEFTPQVGPVSLMDHYIS